MSDIRILYITKLKNSKANGVTVAVSQLLNSICKHAIVGWIDLDDSSFDIDERVERVSVSNWMLFRPDIAVFEDPFNSITFCKLAAEFRKRRIPYVLVPHGCFTKVALQKKAVKKYLAIHTVFLSYLRGCHGTQYLCENEKNNSLLFGTPIVIPNGIPVADDYKEVGEIKKVIFLSRKDVRHKGIDFLLDALALKKDFLKEKSIKVNLYGTTESEEDERFIVEYIASKGLSEIVTNNGPVFGNEKFAVLSGSDLFILTSRHEGFPMSILEALSLGLPVLITKGTNMNDIVQQAHAGWTCETDAVAIARTLEEALTCADCSHISQNARKLSMEYSWDAIAKSTVDKYTKIVISNGEK